MLIAEGERQKMMMKPCPHCNAEVPEESKVCKSCGHAVVKKCPYCAEEIQPTAVRCRYCRADLEATGGKPVANDLPVGEVRGIVLTLVLILLTCGIWGFVLIYQMGEELERHQGKSQINPGMDLVLTLVTCGIWAIYLMYKYPQVLHEITREEGVTPVDLTLPCLLLSVFGLQIVALLIFQDALNKHWDEHRGIA